MKKLFIFLLATLCYSVSFSQKKFKYKNFSPWFKLEIQDDGTNLLIPFQTCDLTNNYYHDDIDTNLVKQLVYEKILDFRKDYEKSSLIKSNELHELAQMWAYDMLVNGYRHSELNGCTAENITAIPTMLFTCIYPENGDINHIVARYIFDGFVGSDAHMDNLTSEKFTTIGVGLAFTTQTIYVVQQFN